MNPECNEGGTVKAVTAPREAAMTASSNRWRWRGIVDEEYAPRRPDHCSPRCRSSTQDCEFTDSPTPPCFNAYETPLWRIMYQPHPTAPYRSRLFLRCERPLIYSTHRYAACLWLYPRDRRRPRYVLATAVGRSRGSLAPSPGSTFGMMSPGQHHHHYHRHQELLQQQQKHQQKHQHQQAPQQQQHQYEFSPIPSGSAPAGVNRKRNGSSISAANSRRRCVYHLPCPYLLDRHYNILIVQ